MNFIRNEKQLMGLLTPSVSIAYTLLAFAIFLISIFFFVVIMIFFFECHLAAVVTRIYVNNGGNNANKKQSLYRHLRLFSFVWLSFILCYSQFCVCVKILFTHAFVSFRSLHCLLHLLYISYYFRRVHHIRCLKYMRSLIQIYVKYTRLEYFFTIYIIRYG